MKSPHDSGDRVATGTPRTSHLGAFTPHAPVQYALVAGWSGTNLPFRPTGARSRYSGRTTGMNAGNTKPTKYKTGNGKLLCGACAQPLAFHVGIEPCPYWEEGRITDRENWVEQSKMSGRKARLRSTRRNQ